MAVSGSLVALYQNEQTWNFRKIDFFPLNFGLKERERVLPIYGIELYFRTRFTLVFCLKNRTRFVAKINGVHEI